MTQENALQDLAYIRQVMEQSRRYTATKGVFFVLWGTLVSLALVCTWLQINGIVGGSNLMVWLVSMGFGWLATLYLALKQRSEGAVPHHAHLIGMNWTAIGIAMGLCYFIGIPTRTIGFQAVPGLSALFCGIGIFNTGHLTGVRWLAGVGIGWLAVGALMLAFPGPHTLWVMIALLVVGEIVPGLVLMREERANRAGAEQARG